MPEVVDQRRAEILVEEEDEEEEEQTESIDEKDDRLDLKMRVRGRDGKEMVMEMESRVLIENSLHFKEIVVRKKEGEVLEVDDVEDLIVFKETIEMMYEVDLLEWLMKAGVSKSIDVLEVSSKIMYDRGISSCLNYIEAVPWTESEEEKLKQLFATHKFDETATHDILARLQPETPPQNLAAHLIQSIISNGNNNTGRKELQSLVNGLISKSSVYQKDPVGLGKDTLYNMCNACLSSLIDTFNNGSVSNRDRIAKEVDSINWLLDILIEKQMAEEFVRIWGSEKELVRIHKKTSPMVRYELSRISASVFIALGKGKIRCSSEVRFNVLDLWFGAMVLDFGWLQRCGKGLDVRVLEEGLGQAVLTLPLKQQQALFVVWFRCFGVQGRECPDLSKAFQVWWRRSFVRLGESIGD